MAGRKQPGHAGRRHPCWPALTPTSHSIQSKENWMSTMTRNRAALAFYTAQTEITDPGEYATCYNDLPTDLPGLHQIVQNIYIHVWKIRKYHKDWLKGRTHEIDSRRVSKSLELV